MVWSFGRSRDICSFRLTPFVCLFTADKDRKTSKQQIFDASFQRLCGFRHLPCVAVFTLPRFPSSSCLPYSLALPPPLLHLSCYRHSRSARASLDHPFHYQYHLRLRSTSLPPIARNDHCNRRFGHLYGEKDDEDIRQFKIGMISIVDAKDFAGSRGAFIPKCIVCQANYESILVENDHHHLLYLAISNRNESD